MTQKEREAIAQSILAMGVEEQSVVLDCIPVPFMLDYISQKFRQQDTFIENVKQAINGVV